MTAEEPASLDGRFLYADDRPQLNHRLGLPQRSTGSSYSGRYLLTCRETTPWW